MLYNKNWDLDENGKILLRAADLIEQFGHTKGLLRDRHGRMCFMGALDKAGVSQQDQLSDISKRTARVLELPASELFNCCSSLVWSATMIEWNNAPERTAQEVIDAMRAAAHAEPEE